jgi:hypothetical protein
MTTFIGVWLLGQLMWSAPLQGTVEECTRRMGELTREFNTQVQLPVGLQGQIQIGCFAAQSQPQGVLK